MTDRSVGIYAKDMSDPTDPVPAAGTGPRDTRSAILDAAILLIGRDGLRGFSASALAAEAGISKATLFHHFRKLDEVPLEAFDRLALGSVAALPPAETLPEALDAIAAGAFALVEGRRDFLAAWFGFMLRALHDPALADRVRASLSAAEAAYAAYLAPVAGARAPAMAGLVIGALDGLLLQALIHGDAAAVRARWDLLAGSLAREGS